MDIPDDTFFDHYKTLLYFPRLHLDPVSIAAHIWTVNNLFPHLGVAGPHCLDSLELSRVLLSEAYAPVHTNVQIRVCCRSLMFFCEGFH